MSSGKFQTRKSFRSTERTKASHSDKLAADKRRGAPAKGGAGGRGTWGKPGDELKYNPAAIDEHDPNFIGDDEVVQETFWEPEDASKQNFSSSVEDLNKFKAGVRTATDAYLKHEETGEQPAQSAFISSIEELGMPLFHQDIPAILVRQVLDKTARDRAIICDLLKVLNMRGLISPTKMTEGFRKVYANVADLQADTPNATQILEAEFVTPLVAAGALDATDAEQLLESAQAVNDAAVVASAKTAFKKIIQEFFTTGEFEEAAYSVEELGAAMTPLHFEFVKQLVSAALDRTNLERELASVLLAGMTGDFITHDATAKGFALLLQRAEDLYIDCPDVLRLLSCFLARAVADEALAPAFLARVDLSENDLGTKVVQQAQRLLQLEKAHIRLSHVWAKHGLVPSEEATNGEVPPSEDVEDETANA